MTSARVIPGVTRLKRLSVVLQPISTKTTIKVSNHFIGFNLTPGGPAAQAFVEGENRQSSQHPCWLLSTHLFAIELVARFASTRIGT